MARKRPTEGDEAHDVLAADEFPPPATADANTVEARAHRLPPDPSGEVSPHDALAAAESPPPAHADVSPYGLDPGPPAPGWRPAAFAAGAALGLLVVLRRLRG